jgi:hypothetical protein
VTTGIRAIRLLCRFGEWISDNWHLQGSSSCAESASSEATWQPPDGNQMFS